MNISKFIGSTLILLGTAVGAGMLALPIISSASGFFPAAILLIAVCGLMTITALLILETTLAFKEYSNNFSTMATSTMGITGKVIIWVSCLLLLYALTAAYIAGSTSLLTTLFGSLHIHMPATVNALLFVAVLGGAVFWSTKTVDLLSRGLWSVKGLLLIVTFILLVPHINFTTLAGGYGFSHSKYLLAVAPIFLCSFGFHTVIPSLTNYIGRDVKQLKAIIITGVSITLCIYLLWLAESLSVVTVANGTSVGDFVKAVSDIVNNKWVTMGINGFANIAMTTSFLGVSLSLFDFLADGFKRKNNISGRAQTALLTFIPPLVFALVYPNGFILALSYASIFVAVICVIMPALMALKLRKSTTLHSPYKFFGGVWLIRAIVVIGIMFIVLQILATLNLLPV